MDPDQDAVKIVESLAQASRERHRKFLRARQESIMPYARTLPERITWIMRRHSSLPLNIQHNKPGELRMYSTALTHLIKQPWTIFELSSDDTIEKYLRLHDLANVAWDIAYMAHIVMLILCLMHTEALMKILDDELFYMHRDVLRSAKDETCETQEEGAKRWLDSQDPEVHAARNAKHHALYYRMLDIIKLIEASRHTYMERRERDLLDLVRWMGVD